MNRRYQNIFTAFVSLLKVRHTKSFSEKLYNEHPNKYNLLGLSQMLDEYNIPNSGVRVDDKFEFNLHSLQTPFIAQLESGFAVVKDISSNKISATLNQYNRAIQMYKKRNNPQKIVPLLIC